jgi:hypothetical protein
MTFLRFFTRQGIAGIAVSLCLSLLLVIQKGETSHWKKQSSRFEQLYAEQKAALAGTVASIRAATVAARAADQESTKRVKAEQNAINERTINDYEARLASVRARADQLRVEAAASAANSGRGGTAAVPTLSAAAGGTPEAAGEDRLPASDALTATEQAIQLDELITWVRAQAKVDNNAPAVASHEHDKAPGTNE